MDLLIHRVNDIHRAKQEWTTVSPYAVWGVNTGYTECVCVCVCVYINPVQLSQKLKNISVGEVTSHL